MSNKLRICFIGLFLAATGAFANPQPDLCEPFERAIVDESVVARMLASAKDGYLYRIQPSSSRVGFCVDSPVGQVQGRFKDFKGGLTFISAVPTLKNQDAMVLIDTRSLETNSSLIESILRGEQFFDVDNYPEMLFVSRQFRWVSDTEALLIGDLTLRDVTREVGFHVQLIAEETDSAERDQEKILVKATTMISRVEFGLGALSPVVGDGVSLCIEVEALRYRSI
jgi:polyisoprenoid-binding protein YceI